MNDFLCEVCGFQTKDEEVASNHKYQHTQQQGFKCDKCNKTIKRRKNYLKHVREQHGLNRFSCKQCNFITYRAYKLYDHKKTHNKKIRETVIQRVDEFSKPALRESVIKRVSDIIVKPTPRDSVINQTVTPNPPQSTFSPHYHKSAFSGKI